MRDRAVPPCTAMYCSVYLKAKEYVELDVGTGGPARRQECACLWPQTLLTPLHSASSQVPAQHRPAGTHPAPCSRLPAACCPGPMDGCLPAWPTPPPPAHHQPRCYPPARTHTAPPAAGAAVAMTSNQWSDVVVWSPWTSMPDCYRSFVCVEHAQFSDAVKLGPGEFWRSQAEWGVKDL